LKEFEKAQVAREKYIKTLFLGIELIFFFANRET